MEEDGNERDSSMILFSPLTVGVVGERVGGGDMIAR